jgi:hypothetical protein
VIAMLLSLAIMNPSWSGVSCDSGRCSIRVIDEGRSLQSSDASSTLDFITDERFKEFVSGISARVLATSRKALPVACKVASETTIDLLFLRRPLLRSGAVGVISESELVLPQAAEGITLDSPWLKFAYSPSRCDVRAIFIWNERQLLLDRALLAGAHERKDQALVPIHREAFADFEKLYRNSIAKTSPGIDSSGDSIPPDVLWLFQQAWPNKSGALPQFDRSVLQAVINRASGTYLIFTTGLLDRVLTPHPKVGERHFRSVFDLKERKVH